MIEHIFAQATPQDGGGSIHLIVAMVLGLGVFYFLTMRSQRREQQKKKDMLAAIKKNDRVMTIGGIIGTVVTAREHEVVLKVDETTNTRMTFRRGAIQQVLTEDDNTQPTG